MFELLSNLFSYIFIAIIYLFIFSIIRLIYMDIRLTSGQNRDSAEAASVPASESENNDNIEDYGECFGILRLNAARENIQGLSDEYILDKDVVTIGRISRAGVCDIEIDDAFLSSEHLKLTFAGGNWYAEDLGSRNGTFVNGETIDYIKLKNGDEITIGGVVFELEVRR